jgi:hypothetical protein
MKMGFVSILHTSNEGIATIGKANRVPNLLGFILIEQQIFTGTGSKKLLAATNRHN